MRWRPYTWPVTLPRIETTPQSISASTWPVSPMISMLSETTRPLRRPSTRSTSRKRSSPENSVPSSRKPFRSSDERPLSLSIVLSLARPRGSLAAAARAQQQLVEALQLGLALELHADRAALAAARDLDARAERAAQALLGGRRVRLLARALRGARRAQQRHAP